MDLIGLILVFLLFWVVTMIIMAIFAILCISFSLVSTYKSKRFLSSRQYTDYKSAKGTYVAALVFFILTCINSVGTVLTLIAFISIIADGSLPREAVFNPTTIFVMVCSAILIAAVTLGIGCFVRYSRVNKLNRQLSAAAAPPPAIFFPATAQSVRVCPCCGSANNIVNRFCVRCGQPIR